MSKVKKLQSGSFLCIRPSAALSIKTINFMSDSFTKSLSLSYLLTTLDLGFVLYLVGQCSQQPPRQQVENQGSAFMQMWEGGGGGGGVLHPPCVIGAPRYEVTAHWPWDRAGLLA